MGAKFKSWNDDSLDRFDSSDPQIPDRCFVSYCDDVHGQPDFDKEVEAPEPDHKELLTAMGTMVHNVLSRQERYVLLQRLIGDTYATIAEESWPRLSGPSQARKIEQRALRKLRERLSKFRNGLDPKLDKSEV
jgi:hypothetical protein